jgi:antitoxin HigA-1
MQDVHSTRASVPACIFKERLLDETGLTQAQLARALGISRPRLNMLLNARCNISDEIALRIERVFGISAEFWVHLRAESSLAQERKRIGCALAELKPIDLGTIVNEDHRVLHAA